MKEIIAIILILAFAAFLIWYSRQRIVPVPYVIPVPDTKLKDELIAEYKQCVDDHKKLLLKHSLVARKNPAQAKALLARIITERDWIDDLRTAITNEYPDVKFI